MEEYNFYCSHHHQDSTFKRKGAWTPEEDDLLRKCVEVYGEGRWHLFPARAGLNRCRKSCRLRWLNYLCPTIKRGELYSMDEIDLVIRLHKLLGNRWSLIAGRLPGRTANQIKNHWNIHFRNRITDCHSSYKDTKKHSCVKVIRPKPRFIKSTIQFDVPRTPGIQPPNQKDKMEASECGPKEHTVQSEEGATTDKEEQDNTYFMNTTPDHEFAPTTTLESMGYEDECIWVAFLENLEHLNECFVELVSLLFSREVIIYSS